MAEPRPTTADGARLIDVDGTAINYLRAGAGSPLVLIHGASSNHRDWTLGAMQAMAERHDVIAFDRPGLGRSGWPGPEGVTLAEQVRLMRGALDRLGISRSIVVGHSYGGSVALAWAVNAPRSVSGLMTLGAPSQVWPGGLGPSTGLLANPVTGPVLARSVEALLPRSVAEQVAERAFEPQAPVPGYLRHLGIEQVVNAGALRRNAQQLGALKEELRALAPRYPALDMPVEILHGTADAVVPIEIHSEPLSRNVPRARLTRLDGIGHMIQHVALPEVLEALARLDTA